MARRVLREGQEIGNAIVLAAEGETVKVRFLCCGKEGVIKHSNLLERHRKGRRFCGSCSKKWVAETAGDRARRSAEVRREKKPKREARRSGDEEPPLETIRAGKHDWYGLRWTANEHTAKVKKVEKPPAPKKIGALANAIGSWDFSTHRA